MHKLLCLFILGVIFSAEGLMAEWNLINPRPTIRDIHSVDFTGANDGWIVGKGGEAFRTTNGGSDWERVPLGVDMELNAVHFISSSVGFINGGINSNDEVILYKTTNGGDSWSEKNTQAPRGLLGMHFPTSTVGYAVGYSGSVCKTTNAGDTWSRTSLGFTSINDVHFTSTTNGIIVGSGGFVRRTTDGGNNWVTISLGCSILYNAVTFPTSSVGYLVGQARIFKTTDGGANWTNITGGITATLNDVTFKDANNGIVVGSNGGIWRTTNGGSSWINQTISGEKNFRNVDAATTSIVYAVGNEGRIYKSTNYGANWTKISESYTTEKLTGTYFTSSSTGHFSGNNGILGVTTNGGDNWGTSSISNSQEIFNLQFLSSSLGYGVEVNGKAIKTTNGGSTWSTFNTTAKEPLRKIFFINSNIGWVCGDAALIYKSTNGGANWVQQTTPTDLHYNSIFFVNTDVGFAVGQNGSILKTTNGGLNWTNSTTNTNDWHRGVYFTDANTGYVVGNNGKIYKTTNQGSNWNALTSGTTNNFNDVYFINASTGFVVGNSGMVLKTNDAGSTFRELNSVVSEHLYGVHFVDENTGYIVGNNGTVMKTVNGGEYQPKLSYPTNNSMITTLTPELEWLAHLTAESYQLQISTSLNNFVANIILDNDELTTNSYTPANDLLDLNQPYYWRVRIEVNGEYTNWSDIWKFTVVPEPEVTLISPVNNATNISIIPTLDWEELAAASYFTVQVSTSLSQFESNLVVDQTNITNDEYQVPEMALLRGTAYYWRARAHLSGGDVTDWTDIWKFTTLPEITPTLSTPTNNTTNLTLLPELNWQSVANATSYELQVSTNSNFTGTLIIDLDDLAITSYDVQAGELTWNTQYYWRIRAVAEGRPTNWSATWNFTTKAMPVVSLTTPADDATNINLNPTLQWAALTDAVNYDVQLFDNAQLSGTPIINLVDFANTSHQISFGNLQRGTTYYWRARAEVYGQTIDWSPAFSFETKPQIDVVLTSPADEAINVSTTLTLVWETVENATSYRIQISTNENDFSSPLHSASGIANSLYSVPAGVLSPNVTYYWRAQATVEQQPTNWSDVWEFTTLMNIDFYLVAPSDEASGQSTTPTFEVAEIEGATSYVIQVSESEDNFENDIVFSKSDLTSNIYTLPEDIIQRDMNYFWRARVVIDQYVSPWTDIWAFSTVDHEIVQLTSPANEAIDLNENSVLLQWQSIEDADSYDVQVSTNGSTWTPLIVNQNLTATSYQIPNDILARETTYFWRARVNIGGYTSPWSLTFEFTTQPNIYITLLSPIDEAENVATSDVDFSWSSSKSGVTYTMQISTSYNNFDLAIIKTETGLTNTEYLLGDGLLQRGNTYYWRTRAVDGDYIGPWSSIFQFATVPMPTVQLVYPSNNSEGIPQNMTFEWGEIEEASMFQIQASTDGDDFLDYLMLDETTSDNNTFTVSQGTLDASTEYFWRVRALVEDEYTSWSAIWSFTTADNITLSLSYSQGWNLISLNVDPELEELPDLFSSLINKVVIMKDGSKIWLPAYDINQIGNWNSEKGYNIFFNQAVSYQVTGLPIVPEERPISLPIGWTVIPYLRQQAMTAEDALVSIEDDLVIVKDINGYVYIPSQEINTIGSLAPGLGYNAFVSTAVRLTYPANEDLGMIYSGDDSYQFIAQTLVPANSRTGNSAVLILNVPQINNGVEVGIYNSADVLIGSGRFFNERTAVTIWGENDMTDEIDGATNNELLTAKIHIDGALQKVTLTNIHDFISGSNLNEITYSKDAVYSAEFEYVSAVTEFNITPNPAKDYLTLEYSADDNASVIISIYNSAGAEVLTINSEGNNYKTLDISHLTQGQYTIVLKIDSLILSEKLIIVK